MIDSKYLSLVWKAGNIAKQLDDLMDRQKQGINDVKTIDLGIQAIGTLIGIQQKRLKECIEDIQKGYKTSGLEEYHYYGP